MSIYFTIKNSLNDRFYSLVYTQKQENYFKVIISYYYKGTFKEEKKMTVYPNIHLNVYSFRDYIYDFLENSSVSDFDSDFTTGEDSNILYSYLHEFDALFIDFFTYSDEKDSNEQEFHTYDDSDMEEEYSEPIGDYEHRMGYLPDEYSYSERNEVYIHDGKQMSAWEDINVSSDEEEDYIEEEEEEDVDEEEYEEVEDDYGYSNYDNGRQDSYYNDDEINENDDYIEGDFTEEDYE